MATLLTTYPWVAPLGTPALAAQDESGLTQAGLVLLGAALAFVATLFIERWKLIRASQTAAYIVARELELHKIRFAMVIRADAIPNAEYQILFTSQAWAAYGSALLAGAPMRHAEAVLNWYATLNVLGRVSRIGGWVWAEGRWCGRSRA
jgi:hypothetical protein